MGRNSQRRRQAKTRASGRAGFGQPGRGGFGQGGGKPRPATAPPPGPEDLGGLGDFFDRQRLADLIDQAQRGAREAPGAGRDEECGCPFCEVDGRPADRHIAERGTTLGLKGFAEKDPELIDFAIELLSEPGPRRFAEQALTAMLIDCVACAWELGWQPLELHRHVGRRVGSSAQQVLADVMAADIAGYARDTVHRVFTDDLRELDAGVWWQGTLLRVRGHRDGWRETLMTVFGLLGVLTLLPELGLLVPLPGAGRVSKSAPTAVDPKMLERVRALLAKAESTTFEAEAETFTAAAQSLMARHSIDAALLAASKAKGEEPASATRIAVDNPYEGPKVSLVQAVAMANRCQCVWLKEVGMVTIVGFAADRQAVETLFTSLLVQAVAAVNREGSRQDRYGRSRTRSFRASFLTAFAGRIGERLAEATQTETEAAAQRVSASGRGDLLPVLRAREAEVDDAFAEMFPNLKQTRLGSVNDAEGWYRGRVAADQASLVAGAPLPSGTG